MRALITTLLASALTLAMPVAGQEPGRALSDDVQRMVRDGMAEALDARLGGGRTAEEKHLLAQAYTNKARRQRQGDERKRAFEQADKKYRAWIEDLEKAARAGKVADLVRLGAARVEFAGMILSGQAASDLDEFEITGGRRGDRETLAGLLKAARGHYEQAQQDIQPLVDDLPAYEEELFEVGLYDPLLQADLDLRLNLGWANYYLGVVAPTGETQRGAHLAAAERLFQGLVNLGQTGQMRYRCYLALAMAQREQGRFDEAERNFGYALGEDVEPTIEAQVRYELARGQVKSGKFDEARTTLRPLVQKNPQNLSREDRPARFYINLAHLWDANSYLVEADVIRAEARGSTARTAILQKAQRSRETGLARMRRLARYGGPWPALVQIYVAASVNLKTPTSRLSVMELLYTAGVLSDAKRYDEALARLQEAASREDLDTDLAGDVLFEIGRCQYQLTNQRGAAEAFGKLAREYRSHAKAPQAATFAYQLWGQIAEDSERQDDYLRLVDTLRNLIESFADHPKRVEAAWLLPVALQLAGRFESAAVQFAKVPEDSKHWEEAQFRRVMCRRRACEAVRGTLSAERYQAKGQRAAAALIRYADEAGERAEAAIDREAVIKWSAEARIAAAELLASQGVNDYQKALELVASFETQYPQSEQLGRVLAARIRAYRGLLEFDEASRILEQFLRAAPPEQVGGTLAALAKGMQEEVQRLLENGQTETARKLAADSVATFEELEKWVRAEPSRARNLDFVLSGRAQMHYLAGQHEEAQHLVSALLKKSPKNGNYQYLQALLLTDRLTEDTSAAEVKKTQDAWGGLLTDPAIRQRAPERYWEARYNWLALALRLGHAADVEKAITQERVWYPDLGGASSKEKLEALLARARVAQGKPAETQPATETQPEGAEKQPDGAEKQSPPGI